MIFLTESFLNVQNFSDSHKRNLVNMMREMNKWFESNADAKAFFDVKPREWLGLLSYIEKKAICQASKRKYLALLKNYANWVCFDLYCVNEKPPYDYSVIFNNKRVQFSQGFTPQPPTFLDMNGAANLLRFLRYNALPRWRIAIELQMFTGCRFSGIHNLRKGDIDWEKRMIQVREKKTTNRSGISFYVIPPHLLEDLRTIAEFSNKDHLFPIAESNYNNILKKFRGDLHSHLLRDFFNTSLFEFNVDLTTRMILLNQTPRNVNESHYLKKYQSWEYRLSLSDSVAVKLCDALTLAARETGYLSELGEKTLTLNSSSRVCSDRDLNPSR